MGIAAIEQALLDQAKAVLGNRMRTYATLPGDWDDEQLARLYKAAPGVLAAFLGGARSNAAGGATTMLNARWGLYVVTGNPSEEARRVGTPLAIGAYQAIEALVPALDGFKVPGCGSTSVADVQNLFTGTVMSQGLTVYAITLGLQVLFDKEVPAELLGDFATFDVQYDIPPLTPAEHAKWLAGDYSTSNPDARDTVALPTT